MVQLDTFFQCLTKQGVTLFTGVPDSLLKDVCAYIQDHFSKQQNIIAANEGNAVGIATGHYLGSGELAMVYMQNSGLGNATNPLLSLTDPDVYQIPMLLLVGWRGEPHVHDEPQHVKQGKITLELLDVMGIPYTILSKEDDMIVPIISDVMSSIKRRKAPFAIVVRKGAFIPYISNNMEENQSNFSREKAIEVIVNHFDPKGIIVSTTGKASRELFEIRESKKQSHSRDFLTVGSMGHASSIALGIALQKPNQKILCLDGDGSLLMHMGSMGIIGDMKPANFTHIIINNQAHESVGGQPTVVGGIDLSAIARACRYPSVYSVDDAQSLAQSLEETSTLHGPHLIEIHTNKESRSDLGRPTMSPTENKEAFINFLRKKKEWER